MDFSEAIIIDTAVNAAGFIAAGALSVLIFSLFGPRSHSAKTRGTDVQTSGSDSGGDHDGRSESMEYVTLSTEGGSAGNNGSSLNSDRRRNRADIIRLARQMMQAGQTPAQVKDLLPVSDGELALLTRNTK
ncbi:MAG: hypothetical protein ACE5FH_04290 [Candidatus Zixiibacteriota bacterium]